MDISQAVVDFTTLAIQAGGYMELDRLYLQNRIIALIGEDSLDKVVFENQPESSLVLLDKLIAKAKENGVIDDSLAQKEILEAQLMDFLTPPPSVVNAFFAQHYAKQPEDATNYFFQLCQENDYIKTRAIAKNVVFPAETEYGNLEITINLSKPEKDPKEIAAMRSVATVNYPKCMLCMENEGYKGRVDYPARTNHRIIRMNLNGESWGFQYSPYAYYNEHCIILSEEHRPMKISRATFERLLSIIEVFPHYFVGSNADLPIVGGSILSHDHYQGGKHTFAMAKAPIEKEISLSVFKNIKAGIVKWPLSVIRLQGMDKNEMINACEYILQAWKQYSDESVSIKAYSEDGTAHHTVTPIARKNGELYEVDLVLRDNNVSAEFPDGIFHPHPDVQHIKKENIGLIEVMGLAVLPPRLLPELLEVEKYVLNMPNEIAAYHKVWADEMMLRHEFKKENAMAVIREEVGQIFARVLEDAGVFKRDVVGQNAFLRFAATL
ncbi:UDP-glucose--hexose-1-phosphate uridylyltransferase [Enterococcus dispar]|uniref:Galactose-1-phosphate uridylyltransferase n=1 Tax=Enterococcus dispar ATCC 51266 TaxID=1139219 RepID=S0KDC4_9ENTE|nr:UDP-glucose--hexose-1-phosphate uridylyltransferase [Enterococcus dispar]EOT42697.1 galactose-1-phosphate uridylyltransferase [Enterococcus dispar ATCC 51266]EOW84852.1 galactose-1-phosphate uridylyltransferase [Enterococcus dispar ATCC 51266]MCU7356202.1 UDP-glucose--hexose-1-phosphate uridylyltransferase [Enterococcus dispar]MDT2704705.1 UDP-glucose--hexose-1-phosphate uridylyltransferase [Enterococcus dispar]WCG34328.1 UDP-glucose--hexose-1-phosphate uridylyltransferase [Enterococcus dis